jgi:hypothetical protein
MAHGPAQGGVHSGHRIEVAVVARRSSCSWPVRATTTRHEVGKMKESSLGFGLMFGFIFQQKITVDLVRGSWTSAGWGPQWTQKRGGGGGSPELLLLTGTGHDGSS